MVNGYPFMPKIIEHNGESLEFLHSLGFNCRSKAVSHRPATRDRSTSGTQTHSSSKLNVGFIRLGKPKSILCWISGGSLTSNQLPQLKEQVSQLQLNSSKQRPLVGTIESGFDDVSRYTDICQLYWQPLSKA